MSFLLAAVQQVQQPVVKTVEVVKEVPVTQVVYATPEWFNQAVATADYAAPLVLAVAASKLHSLAKDYFPTLKEDTLDWFNSVLMFTYVFFIAAGYMAMKGQFLFDSPQALVSSLQLAFVGAQGRYATLKAFSWVNDLKSRRAAAVTAPDASPALAGKDY